MVEMSEVGGPHHHYDGRVDRKTPLPDGILIGRLATGENKATHLSMTLTRRSLPSRYTFGDPTCVNCPAPPVCCFPDYSTVRGHPETIQPFCSLSHWRRSGGSCGVTFY